MQKLSIVIRDEPYTIFNRDTSTNRLTFVNLTGVRTKMDKNM